MTLNTINGVVDIERQETQSSNVLKELHFPIISFEQYRISRELCSSLKVTISTPLYRYTL